jgi:putative CocE/NonD family hydrolase
MMAFESHLSRNLNIAILLCLVCAIPKHSYAVQSDPEARAAYTEHTRDSLYVAMRDKTRLAVNIYRPATHGRAVATPLPVIFAFTPYRARYREADGSIVETALNERLGLPQLLQHGYVIAVADIRGKGASFGHRRGFQDRTEALDGRELVEWLARQEWADGNVGMTGCSYLGGSTLHVASTAPPSLKAVFIGASDFDKYAFVRRGGLTAQFNTRPDEPAEWDLQSLPMDEDTDGGLLRAAVAEHAANTPMADLWYGMPYRDSLSAFTGNAFWEEVGPYTYLQQLKASNIAFYLWGTWSDEPTEQIMLAAANLPARVMIGPGSHCQPSAEFDFAGEMLRFFDHHLKGIETGITGEPAYTWRLQNAGPEQGWVRSDKLPGEGLARTDFYLAVGPQADSVPSAGLLLAEPASQSGKLDFSVDYDLDNQEYFAFWPAPMDEHGLVFTGPELANDLALAGFPIARLRVSVDRTDANVFAYLEDVAPDGEVTVVSFARLAASHRRLSQAPYANFGLPWHSGRSTDVQAMVPGQAELLEFSLLPNAWVFRAGHRMRLTITGADPSQRNLAAIAEDPPPQISIWMGGTDGSSISVPLVDPQELLAPAVVAAGARAP